MSDQLLWQVRVLDQDGRIAGAGVLVDARHVLTCAHVVNTALGRGEDSTRPDQAVRVDFLQADEDPIPARVLTDGWIPAAADGRRDVAVLALPHDAPRGTGPAPLRRPARLLGHRFDAFGFPRGYDTGVSATGQLRRPAGPGREWVELQVTEVPGHRVEKGFSGTAVYDHEVQAVVGIVVADDKRAETKLAWMLPLRTIVQYWPPLEALVRHWALYEPGELASHWSPKARGVERENKPGWYFTGRTQALQELVAWLGGGRADGRVRAVTGGPGSGKSAVLARVVTLADPVYRQRVPDLEPAHRTVPPVGCVQVAVHARHKTVDDVVRAIARATELEADAPDALIDALLARAELRTIVVDALDEAVEPTAIAGKLLRPLAADARVRVLAGTRPGLEDELLNALGSNVVRLDLDNPPYLEQADLVEYVCRRLLLIDQPTAPTPYRGQVQLAEQVAVAVATRAYPTFLIAQLVSRTLVEQDSVVDVGVPEWQVHFPASVADAMQSYLERFGADERKVRDLLRPLAFAEGEGIAEGPLWVRLAADLSGRPYEQHDLTWLLQSAAAYLVETPARKEEGTAYYRLYHAALADYLRWDYLRSRRLDQRAAERMITSALFAEVPRGATGELEWSAAPAYVREHLATHAAAGKVLDELLSDPGYLLTASPGPLLRALPAAQSPDAQRAAHGYRLIEHRLRDTPDRERVSYLELAARQAGATSLADRIAQIQLPQSWSARWARWISIARHTVLGRHPGEVTGVATGVLNGRPIAVTCGIDGSVRVWDVIEANPIGSPLTGHRGPVRAVAVAEVDRRPIAVTGGDDGTVRVWDLATRRARELTGHGGPVRAVALGAPDDRPIAVTGGQDGTIRIWDLHEGRQVGELLPGRRGNVNAIVIAYLDNRPSVMTGGDDGVVRVWDLEHRTRPDRTLRVGNPINALSVGTANRGRVVVVGSLDVQVWDLTTRKRVRVLDESRVTALAVGRSHGRLLCLTGSLWTLRVWDLDKEEASGTPFLGHNGWVSAVAFGEVDGHPVAVTGADDTTVRTWDLALEGAERTSQTGFEPLIIAELNNEPTVVAGDAVGKLHVWGLHDSVPRREPLEGYDQALRAMGFVELRHRPFVVTSDYSGVVRLRDLTAKTKRSRILGGAGYAYGIATGQLDGLPIAALSGIRGIELWDLSTRTRLSKQFTYQGQVLAVAFGTVDGRPIVVGGCEDGAVRVWDLIASRRSPRKLVGHTGNVWTISLGELDGRPVAVSGGWDGTVRIWDMAAGVQLGDELLSGDDRVLASALGVLEGRLIAAAGTRNGTMHVWDVRTRTALWKISIDALVDSIAMWDDWLIVCTYMGAVGIRLKG